MPSLKKKKKNLPGLRPQFVHVLLGNAKTEDHSSKRKVNSSISKKSRNKQEKKSKGIGLKRKPDQSNRLYHKNLLPVFCLASFVESMSKKQKNDAFSSFQTLQQQHQPSSVSELKQLNLSINTHYFHQKILSEKLVASRPVSSSVTVPPPSNSLDSDDVAVPGEDFIRSYQLQFQRFILEPWKIYRAEIPLNPMLEQISWSQLRQIQWTTATMVLSRFLSIIASLSFEENLSLKEDYEATAFQYLRVLGSRIKTVSLSACVEARESNEEAGLRCPDSPDTLRSIDTTIATSPATSYAFPPIEKEERDVTPLTEERKVQSHYFSFLLEQIERLLPTPSFSTPASSCSSSSSFSILSQLASPAAALSLFPSPYQSSGVNYQELMSMWKGEESSESSSSLAPLSNTRRCQIDSGREEKVSCQSGSDAFHHLWLFLQEMMRTIL